MPTYPNYPGSRPGTHAATHGPGGSDPLNLAGMGAASTIDLDAEIARATAAEALLAPIASPTFTGTVGGITKTMVGLGNVDNTSDANKPVSTAQQTALNLKADETTTISGGGLVTGGGDLSANRTLTVTASTTAQGIAGTDTTTAMTPAADKAALDAKVDPVANSRAPRQGLVFDGTAGASANISAVGTGDFTMAFVVRLNGLPLASNHRIFCSADSSFQILINTSGVLSLAVPGGGTLTSGITLGLDRFYTVAFSRLGTTVSFFLDGVLTGTANTSASIPAIVWVGREHTAVDFLNGILATPLIYNYALTAAQVAALFRDGAPAAVDRGGSMTAIISNTFDNESAGWSSVNAGSITNQAGFATFSSIDGDSRVQTSAGLISVNKRFRIAFEYRAATAGDITVNQYYTVLATAAVIGDNTWRQALVEFTQVSGAYGANIGLIRNAGDFDVRNLSIIPLGTLLALDANQPGAGPQWRDVSGNNTHLALPGDGVTGGVQWALPGGSGSDFGETRTASGYALGRDAVVIPEGYRIARIWCSGDGTFSLGNAASGTEIVNAFTATATSQPATLADYVTASRKLYLTLGTATTVTYTVHLERI